MDPRTTQITIHKVDCWNDDGNSVSYKSREHSPMNHLYSNRYYDSLNISKGYYFSPYGDGGGDVGPMNIHFYPPKEDFGRDRKYWGLFNLIMSAQHTPWVY